MKPQMDEGADIRSWDELIPDALGLIFRNLSLQEVLTVVPRVCRSWGKVVMGPYCWQEIDIEEWSDRSEPENIDRLLRMLIVRSSGSLRKLCVSGLQNDLIFSFIAEHAGSLQTLRLPGSDMSDAIVEQVAGRLSTVTFLDLSYCDKIGAPALEAIGRNCKLLAGLRRNMNPMGMDGKLSQEDEARAIAATMPNLKRLEIAYPLIDTDSIVEIICSCQELEFLDLRGCWDVKLDDKYISDKFPNLKILRPQVIDHYETNNWDVCSDYTDSYDGKFSFEGNEALWDDDFNSLELSSYEGFDENGWPPSP